MKNPASLVLPTRPTCRRVRLVGDGDVLEAAPQAASSSHAPSSSDGNLFLIPQTLFRSELLLAVRTAELPVGVPELLVAVEAVPAARACDPEDPTHFPSSGPSRASCSGRNRRARSTASTASRGTSMRVSNGRRTGLVASTIILAPM